MKDDIFTILVNDHITVYFVVNKNPEDKFVNFILFDNTKRIVSNLTSNISNEKFIKGAVTDNLTYEEMLLYIDFLNDLTT